MFTMEGLPVAAAATAGRAVRALGMTAGPVVADVKTGVEATPGTGSVLFGTTGVKAAPGTNFALVGTTGVPGSGGGTDIEAPPAA